MGKFVCIDCGYRFDSNKEKPKKCPYCASESIERERSAEELVDSVDVK